MVFSGHEMMTGGGAGQGRGLKENTLVNLPFNRAFVVERIVGQDYNFLLSAIPGPFDGGPTQLR